jgi:hypothetical protein
MENNIVYLNTKKTPVITSQKVPEAVDNEHKNVPQSIEVLMGYHEIVTKITKVFATINRECQLPMASRYCHNMVAKEFPYLPLPPLNTFMGPFELANRCEQSAERAKQVGELLDLIESKNRKRILTMPQRNARINCHLTVVRGEQHR